MDGIHDLGGKQGYGPVEVDEDETPFHHDWEAREWGIAQCARTPGITIDWWRHCRELILPQDYLEKPYFDSWAQTDIATYIEAGWMSLEEIVSGDAEPNRQSVDDLPAAMTLQQVLEEDHHHAVRFDAGIDVPAGFEIGQSVKTNSHGHSGHTRLPQYARDRRGIVTAHHGAHVFPDLSAQGEEIHQHLYTVEFTAPELWGDSAQSKDKIYLDLWESYLSEA
ncbi:MAG: nitrile hydratase subunit beta [Pseudomonadota bacterium]